MKKFLQMLLCLVLAVSLLMSFAACSSTDDGGNQGNASTPNNDDNPGNENTQQDNGGVTGLENYLAYQNARDYYLGFELKPLNGFGAEELQQICDFLWGTEMDVTLEYDWERRVNSYNNTYGEDYKYSFRTIETDVLTVTEREKFQTELRNFGTHIQQTLDTTDPVQLATIVGLDADMTFLLMQTVWSLAQKLANATVEEGYEYDGIFISEGSKLSTPLETPMFFYSYKVDGCWMPEQTLTILANFLSRLGID